MRRVVFVLVLEASRLLGEKVEIYLERASRRDLRYCRRQEHGARIFQREWVLAPELIASSRIVAWLRTSHNVSVARYWTIQQDKDAVTVYAKTSPFPSATPFDRFIKYTNCDENLRSSIGRRSNDCIAIFSTESNDINLARNTAVLRLGNYEYFLGGEHSVGCGEEPGDPCGSGASMLRRPVSSAASSFDRKIDVVIDGFHEGCIDLRKKVTHCEFDGRWSLAVIRRSFSIPDKLRSYGSTRSRFLVGTSASIAGSTEREESQEESIIRRSSSSRHYHHSRRQKQDQERLLANLTQSELQQQAIPSQRLIFVYGRANLHPIKGGRWTVAASVKANEFVETIEDGQSPPFQRFHLVKFADYDKLFYGNSRTANTHFLHRINKMVESGSTHINLYYFAVNPNPIDRGATLLAVYPIVISAGDHRHTSFIGLSLSCDGYHFSAPYPILQSTKATHGSGGGRGMDQPADGFVSVPPATAHTNTITNGEGGGHFVLYEHINVRGIAPSKDPSGNFFDVPPHLVAHIIPRTSLAKFTAKAKAHLRRAYSNQGPSKQAAACLLHGAGPSL